VHHARDVFFLNITRALIKHVWPGAVVHRAHQNRVLLKKITTVKIIFTIFSVVELKSTGATFAYMKRPSIGAFLGFLPFICFSVREFQIFPNGGKI
jgi:hypothetical protein